MIVRGGSVFASGIVLVTPLDLDVTEQVEGGLLRATVRDATSGARLPDVQVRVIGSSSGIFVAGQTDLRGVFLAQGIRGHGRGGRRARGRADTPSTGGPRPSARSPARRAPEGGRASSLDDDLRERNRASRDRQLERFDKRMGGGMGGMGGMMGGGFR